TKVREARSPRDEPTAVKGSTRLEAKKQRRREGREAGRRRTIITEAEFLARRESVDRVMVVRGRGDRTQIGVLEDGVLVEHYVSRETTASMAGNVYLGRVQNVLPSMEAAFVDIGKGRNAVLYAGEVNWDAAGLEGGQSRRIEHALKSGDTVLVQVTKDPIGHKGARLTSQISLPGRYLVYVPEGSMTGISRKLPDTERARLKGILKEVVPDSAGVIVRTAAEGASEEELTADVERLTKAWEKISKKAESAMAKKAGSGGAPMLLHGEPDLTVRVIRDVFTEDFSSLVVSGDKAWSEVSTYIEDVAPDLASRVTRWTSDDDVFASHRIDEQIAKAMDRKVWLPSGGSLVIDRTEAMTVVDVNTGKFIGSGGNLEETVTKNNLEAAEEIVRQLRLRDIGGIIVVDFIDMVLESNRDLVVRRLLECLGRDRTKHQVAEVTSLGLVQMTRKRVGSGLIEVFSEPCEHCNGSGVVVHTEPIDRSGSSDQGSGSGGSRSGRGRRGAGSSGSSGSGSSGSGSGGNGNNGGNGGTNGEAAPRTPSG
ncbi:MAG: Rne/Rng family ribonuclease, partial [Ornithinibacter sp.]